MDESAAQAVLTTLMLEGHSWASQVAVEDRHSLLPSVVAMTPCAYPAAEVEAMRRTPSTLGGRTCSLWAAWEGRLVVLEWEVICLAVKVEVLVAEGE